MADHGSVYKPGDGQRTRELQVLPPGQTVRGGQPLCRQDDIYPGALVRSPSSVAALGEFYAPAIREAGVQDEPPEVSTQATADTRIHFRCADGKAGGHRTDTGYEFYSVSLAR